MSGSAQAIKRGRRACEAKTPRQIVKRFGPEARLSNEQRRALAQLERAEAHPGPDFVAGQLAAMVYEGTLAGQTARFGYEGCVYALALGAGARPGGGSAPSRR